MRSELGKSERFGWMKGCMMTLWVFPPPCCAMVFVAAMVFFAEAPAGAIIACEPCLLVRKMETAAEYYVREGVLRGAVSALSPSGDFFKVHV